MDFTTLHSHHLLFLSFCLTLSLSYSAGLPVSGLQFPSLSSSQFNFAFPRTMIDFNHSPLAFSSTTSCLHFSSSLLSPLVTSLQLENIILQTIQRVQRSQSRNVPLFIYPMLTRFSVSRLSCTYLIPLCHPTYLSQMQLPVLPAPHLSFCRL